MFFERNKNMKLRYQLLPICLIVDFTKKNREIELSKLAFLKFNSQKNCEIELHTTYFKVYFTKKFTQIQISKLVFD